MVAGHAGAYRVRSVFRRRASAHASAVIGIGCAGGLVLGGVTWTGWQAGLAGGAVLCQLAYAAAVCGAMAVLYLDAVNIAETSLHMHVLLRIAWGERRSLDALVREYGAERIVAERLERLTVLGQIRCEGGRYYVGNRSTLRLARAIDLWRTVLGLPTSPADAGR